MHPTSASGDATSAQITLSSPPEDIVAFFVVATDPRGAVGARHVTLDITPASTPVTSGNPLAHDTPPWFTTTPITAVPQGADYRYQAIAEDPDGAVSYSLEVPPGLGISLNPSTGLVTWTDVDGPLGPIDLTVTATQGGVSSMQPFALAITDPTMNNAPTIQPAIGLSAVEGTLFLFDVIARDVDAGDFPLIYQLVDDQGNGVTEFDGFSINGNGRINWIATDQNTSFTVRVSDPHGAVDERTFDVTVAPDRSPSVTLRVSSQTPQEGDRILLLVEAADDIGLADVRLKLTDEGSFFSAEGHPLSVSYGVATYVIPAGLSSFDVTASAIDSSGQEASTSPLRINIVSPDPAAPVIEVASPLDGALVREDLDIVGKLYDPEDPDAQLVFYTVTATSDGGDPIVIASEGQSGGSTIIPGISSLANPEAVIATISPFALANGPHRIEITAENAGGHIRTLAFGVMIETDVKLDNFSVSFTDLTVPIASVPIVVQRTYDSFKAHEPGDFGYGWSLNVLTGDLDVQTAQGSGDEVWRDLGLGYAPPLFNGSRVTLTLPGGDTQSFSAVPVPLNPNGSLAGAIASSLIQNYTGLSAVAFLPDPGQESRLDLVGGASYFYPEDYASALPERLQREKFGSMNVIYDDATGDFRDEIGLPFNPASSSQSLDYRLTTADGREYIFDSTTGKLRRYTDAEGRRLEFSPNEIVALNADDVEIGGIRIHRSGDRITRIEDPDGNAITYGYDSHDNLVSVRNRAANAAGTAPTTTLQYGESEYSEAGVQPGVHILTSIHNALNIPVLQVGFDSEGRISKLYDPDGNSAGFSYSFDLPDGRSVETISDAGSTPATTEIVRDARGNVERRVALLDDDLYQVTVFRYDAHGNQTHISIPFETNEADRYQTGLELLTDPMDPGYEASVWESVSVVDASGNVTSSTDALGNTTHFTYTDGQLETITDPLNNLTTNSYSGNRLTETIGAEGLLTRFDYDGRGNLQEVVQVDGDTSEVPQSDFTYDNAGRLASSTDASGVARYFTYDNRGNQTLSYFHWDDPATVPPDIDQTIVHRTFYDVADRVTGTAQYTVADEQFYTAATQLTGDADWETSTEYNAAGQVVQTEDRHGTVTTYHYDARGNVVETRTVSWHEDGSPTWIVTRSAYDTNGRLTFTTDPHVEDDPVGAPQAAPGTRTVYDSLGRVRNAAGVGANHPLRLGGRHLRSRSCLRNQSPHLRRP